MLKSLAALLAVAAVTPQTPAPKASIEDYVKANVSAAPASLGFDPFHKKYADSLGIPMLSSEKVPDQALIVARDVVIHMLAKRPELRSAMIEKNMRVGIMALSESTTDIPEHRDRRKPPPGDPRLTDAETRGYATGTGIAAMTDKEYWDRRARGTGVPLP